jgi:hypothetical protein
MKFFNKILIIVMSILTVSNVISASATKTYKNFTQAYDEYVAKQLIGTGEKKLVDIYSGLSIADKKLVDQFLAQSGANIGILAKRGGITLKGSIASAPAPAKAQIAQQPSPAAPAPRARASASSATQPQASVQRPGAMPIPGAIVPRGPSAQELQAQQKSAAQKKVTYAKFENVITNFLAQISADKKMSEQESTQIQNMYLALAPKDKIRALEFIQQNMGLGKVIQFLREFENKEKLGQTDRQFLVDKVAQQIIIHSSKAKNSDDPEIIAAYDLFNLLSTQNQKLVLDKMSKQYDVEQFKKAAAAHRVKEARSSNLDTKHSQDKEKAAQPGASAQMQQPKLQAATPGQAQAKLDIYSRASSSASRAVAAPIAQSTPTRPMAFSAPNSFPNIPQHEDFKRSKRISDNKRSITYSDGSIASYTLDAGSDDWRQDDIDARNVRESLPSESQQQKDKEDDQAKIEQARLNMADNALLEELLDVITEKNNRTFFLYLQSRRMTNRPLELGLYSTKQIIEYEYQEDPETGEGSYRAIQVGQQPAISSGSK